MRKKCTCHLWHYPLESNQSEKTPQLKQRSKGVRLHLHEVHILNVSPQLKLEKHLVNHFHEAAQFEHVVYLSIENKEFKMLKDDIFSPAQIQGLLHQRPLELCQHCHRQTPQLAELHIPAQPSRFPLQ